MGRKISFLGIAAVMIGMSFSGHISCADDIVTYDADDFDNLSGRTQEDVKERYAQALAAGDTYFNASSESYYSVAASTSYPYEKGTISADTLESMAAMTNFYRWLVGVNPIDVNTQSNDSLQAQALDRNFEFNHYISASSKPDDMDQDIWDEGFSCDHNILAWGYTPQGAVTGWLNEGYRPGTGSFDTVGHRTAILTASRAGILYGYSGSIAVGKCVYGSNTFENPFAAFPAAGYMPSGCVYSSECAWTVELNSAFLKVSDASGVTVTVTDTTTGDSYTCTKANGYLQTGSYLLTFVQPTISTSRYSDTYNVQVTGLYDTKGGKQASIEYTVDFFDESENLLKNSCVSLACAEYRYTGSAVKPEVTVTYSGSSLTEGTDYTVRYVNNKAVGTAYYFVTGKGQYYGTAKGSFKIRKDSKKIEDCLVGNISSYSYDGREKRPTVTISDFGEVLKEGEAYTLTYANNVNAGIASILVTGIGEYTGSRTINFKIYKSYPSVTAEFTEIELGGTSQISHTGTGAATYTSSDTTIATVDGSGSIRALAEGTATITVSVTETDNYYSTTKKINITVSKDYHNYELKSEDEANGSDNTATLHYTCKVCGAKKDETVKTLTSFTMFYKRSDITDDSYYYTYVARSLKEGVSVDCWAHVSYMKPSDADIKTVIYSTSDPDVVEIEGTKLIMKNAGTATITISAKYNPSVKTTLTFNVLHDWKASVFTWNADYSSVQAKRVCKVDAGHVEQVNAVLSRNITKAPTTDAAGTLVITATATYADGTSETDTKTCSLYKTLTKTVAATCTVDGYYKYRYDVYDGNTLIESYTEQEAISAKGHVTELVNVKEATTAEAGYTGDTVCTVCNEVIEAGTIIPKLPEKKNGWKKEDGIWYYYKEDVKLTGWLKVNSTWYYLGEGGAMQTGWITVNGYRYYLAENGAMQTGWQKVDGYWYYFAEGGKMQTGWIKLNGSWYYLAEDGKMQTGWLKVNGYWYYLKSNGRMAECEWVNGYWLSAGGKWTYTAKGSWKQNSKGWWFGDTSGWYAKNETVKINDKMYTFDANGYMI